jgi:hypothetical protein
MPLLFPVPLAVGRGTDLQNFIYCRKGGNVFALRPPFYGLAIFTDVEIR